MVWPGGATGRLQQATLSLPKHVHHQAGVQAILASDLDDWLVMHLHSNNLLCSAFFQPPKISALGPRKQHGRASVCVRESERDCEKGNKIPQNSAGFERSWDFLFLVWVLGDGKTGGHAFASISLHPLRFGVLSTVLHGGGDVACLRACV